MRHALLGASIASLLGAGLLASGLAQAQPPRGPAPADYANPENWLCLPGRADACAVDLSAMHVNVRGAPSLEEFRPARNPRADCFYVYPTVSADRTQLSDLLPGPEERRVIASQFARFGAACRTFAPLYRQLTLSGLGAAMAASPGAPTATGREVFDTLPLRAGYDDVRAAFQHYLGAYNTDRPFVLIGHSQGAMHLARLIQEEIEGTPLQGQMAGAILLGANIEVPPGRNLGGTFRSVPLCRTVGQTGCVITYASYRVTNPPGPAPLFGQGRDGMIAGCTNPANLRTGRGNPVSYFNTGTLNWTGDVNRPVGTPFVKPPGLTTTTCVSGPAGTYLEVKVNADPKGARIDDIPGDFIQGGRADPNWGLHNVDMNLSLGNLVDHVTAWARAWRPAR